ncbi:peptidase S8/S53 subtilisin kexin sedolisin [Mycolicibacterium thermoresistibile]|nr:type VII secretion-associated serine protease mycosin [Mycolicibacterium thermoresistibile]MCV7187693.1 type VII secretion-associated serine protease mycosin [Mycolicibacterium thermoresistibile]SNW17206.1 peptidase S8/S53 subtilisin kexin sedolisin [Mycolicibacterium thermoresistibile]
MRSAPARLARGLAIAVTASLVGAAPGAHAVTPPPIDHARLPHAGPAAPPQRTEQQGPCLRPAQRRTGDAVLSGFTAADLAAVWRLTRGGGQAVAVIDTGVARHRLLPRVIPGGDFVHRGDGTDDCDGHGTIVAGLIAAAPGDGRAGFSGIAPESSIIAIRQSSNKFRATDQPSGTGYGDVDTLAMAIRTAADLGASVINVSSVACLAATEPPDDRALGAALAYAVDVRNAVVVSAAGNVGGAGQCPHQNPVTGRRPDWATVRAVVTPAWYDDLVLTVGSVNAEGHPSDFTLAGPWVDVAAPGEDVLSLDPDGEGLVDALPGPGGDTPIAGTSYAAPLVAGLAALVRARWPQLTARQVMQRIRDTARTPASGWNPLVGHGVIDPLAAVSGDPAPGRPAPAHLTRTLPAPTTPAADPAPRRIAFGGALLCLAAAGAAVFGRSGRRGPVAAD